MVNLSGKRTFTGRISGENPRHGITKGETRPYAGMITSGKC